MSRGMSFGTCAETIHQGVRAIISSAIQVATMVMMTQASSASMPQSVSDRLRFTCARCEARPEDDMINMKGH